MPYYPPYWGPRMETVLGLILLSFGIGVRSCDLELDTLTSVVNLEHGDNFQITCYATCVHTDDVIDVRWYDDNQQPITNIPSRVFTVSYNKHQGRLLLLTNVQADDTGRYTCMGEMRYQNITQSVDVIVIDKSVSTLLADDEFANPVWVDSLVDRGSSNGFLHELFRRQKRDDSFGSGATDPTTTNTNDKAAELSTTRSTQATTINTNDEETVPSTKSTQATTINTNDEVTVPSTKSTQATTINTNDEVTVPSTRSTQATTINTNDEVTVPSTRSTQATTINTNDEVTVPSTRSTQATTINTNDEVTVPSTISTQATTINTNDEVTVPSTRSTQTTTINTNEEATLSAFGRYGILAFSLSLSLAFLLLYALILVLILPRCCKNRKKKHDLHKGKSNTKNSNAEFLTFKPLQQQTSDDQGFITIDLDAPNEIKEGQGGSDESPQNESMATDADEQQKKFVTTFLIGRSISNPDGDSSNETGHVYIHEPISGDVTMTTDLDELNPEHKATDNSKDVSKVTADGIPLTETDVLKDVSAVSVVSGPQTEITEFKVDKDGRPSNGKVDNSQQAADELASSGQSSVHASKQTDASVDGTKVLGVQQTTSLADGMKETELPDDAKETKPLADVSSKSLAEGAKETTLSPDAAKESLDNASQPNESAAEGKESADKMSMSLFAPETNDSGLGSLADEFAKCLDMTNKDSNVSELERNGLLDADPKLGEHQKVNPSQNDNLNVLSDNASSPGTNGTA